MNELFIFVSATVLGLCEVKDQVLLVSSDSESSIGAWHKGDGW